jgi:hypothetical protein
VESGSGRFASFRRRFRPAHGLLDVTAIEPDILEHPIVERPQPRRGGAPPEPGEEPPEEVLMASARQARARSITRRFTSARCIGVSIR